jgi:hypothetical protein
MMPDSVKQSNGFVQPKPPPKKKRRLQAARRKTAVPRAFIAAYMLRNDGEGFPYSISEAARSVCSSREYVRRALNILATGDEHWLELAKHSSKGFRHAAFFARRQIAFEEIEAWLGAEAQIKTTAAYVRTLQRRGVLHRRRASLLSFYFPNSYGETSLATTSQIEHFLSTVFIPRVLVGVDATMSRQETWDLAAQIQSEMFVSAAGLELQLTYFRGAAEFVAVPWTRDPQALARTMASVSCMAGHTQWGRVLAHAVAEHKRRPFNAVVLIGDCVEEPPGSLYDKAGALGGIPVFCFHEGEDERAAAIFKNLAEITKGAFAKFSADSPRELAELLKAIGAFARGGIQALEAQGTAAARLLLAQVRK